jgi:hypothetical protein
MDPIHAAYLPDGLLWEAEGDVVADDGTKVGCQSLTVHRVITPPVLPQAVRVRVAIYAVQRVMPTSQCQSWHEWAHSWLSGTDRSAKAAEEARAAAWAAEAEAEAEAAARAAARAAAWAAEAAWAARAAARAARAAARAAAESAAEAAESARDSEISFALQAHIEKAMQDEPWVAG